MSPLARIERGKRLVAKLHLNLKGEYFDQIASLEKPDEYRLCTPYWTKRIEGRIYDGIVLKNGYPKAGDASRTLERPWRGYVKRNITHKHFGPKEVTVYAIKVN